MKKFCCLLSFASLCVASYAWAVFAVDSIHLIKISASSSVAPYVILPKNGKSLYSGIEVDIVREAFKEEGFTIAIVTMPTIRAKTSFVKGFVDAVLINKTNNPLTKGAFFSDTYITYQNIAVSLAKKQFEIRAPVDLSGKKVIAFQQAASVLGSKFKDMSETNPCYLELSNQNKQVEMLFREHADVAVLEKRIFTYLSLQISENPLAKQIVTFHNIFAPTHYRVAFQLKVHRDAFNRGLQKIKKSGRYQQIIDSYENR